LKSDEYIKKYFEELRDLKISSNNLKNQQFAVIGYRILTENGTKPPFEGIQKYLINNGFN
jgi:hypothetical protein